MEAPRTVLQLIATLGQVASEHNLESLCAKLDAARLDEPAHAVMRQAVGSVIGAEPRQVASALAEALLPEGSRSPREVALGLRAAAAAARLVRRETKLDLAWTGPVPPSHTLRRTGQAFLDVVRRADERLWLVSYAVHYTVDVTAALLEAAQRGAEVRLVLESAQENPRFQGVDGITAMPPELRDAVRVFVWPRARRPADAFGNVPALHAKLALADSRLLFVTSANLTGKAHETNIELGFLIEGGRAPEWVAEQLEWLVEQGHLHLV